MMSMERLKFPPFYPTYFNVLKGDNDHLHSIFRKFDEFYNLGGKTLNLSFEKRKEGGYKLCVSPIESKQGAK